jgi:hypothetical protein
MYVSVVQILSFLQDSAPNPYMHTFFSKYLVYATCHASRAHRDQTEWCLERSRDHAADLCAFSINPLLRRPS